ncbi:MAG: flagellar filament capping protein FliD [Deltaproteobacteria bacterium]|nr:flagellar filament capping protein FliD [Deltaproteobacteria bacterium]
MSISTNLISGLSSGFDWRSMIDQLIAIDRGRVDLVEGRKSEYESQLAEWQNVNTMLLSLKTASAALSTESAFNVFKSSITSSAESGTPTAASSLLTISTSSTASPALYNIKVNNLAQSEKISSTNYTATDTALEMEGDILVSGKVVNIVSTDTLADIKDKINAVNTGSDPSNVTASIVSHSSTNYHLILTSDNTGEDGLSVLEGAYDSGDNILEEMGFISSSTTIKTATSDGAKSDLFTSSDGIVATLLNLTNAPADPVTVTIGGNNVDIDLDSESITDIASTIDALAGISAEVVSETVDGETKYRIDISGTTSFTDSGNVLQTLGILEGTYGTVAEVHSGSVNYDTSGSEVDSATLLTDICTGIIRGDVANVELDSDPISATTVWNDIDTGGAAIKNTDSIDVVGTKHDGTAVNVTFTIDDATDTLGETDGFLDWLETQFGGSANVDAYFDSSGRLVLEDLQSGSSQLSITDMTYNGIAVTFSFSSAEPFDNTVAAGDTITISGTQGDGTSISTTYTVVDGHDIQDLLDKINNAVDGFGSGTRTAIASVSADGKIIITDGTAGNSQLLLTLVANNEGGGSLNFGEISMLTEGRSMQVAAGEDAEIVVDNVTITNSSNTIEDVIAGATLNLVGEDSDTTVTLKIERDLASIKSKIEDMVSAYNSIMDYINIQFTYDDDTEQVGGILFGDGTLSTIKSELINTVTRTVAGASSDYNKLALIGIALDVVDTDEGEYNKLNLVIDDDGADDNDLMDYLETNFDDVKKLFIASGSSPYSNLTYIGHTDDTEGGAYNVTISQAATRGTTTGSNALVGTIADDEEVTLTDFATGRIATVDLTIGMDINDVINAINSEFAREYTEQLTGATSNAGVTSTTLLNDALVGGEDNDVITFSGIKRNGISVSGSYTISDATTETVGNLLEAIEDMYEDGVTVAMDGDGKIVITNTQAGDSNLSFNIDTSALTDLDFGDVSTTTEGRYSMAITASENDDNKLVLTHNTYGTGQQVTTKSENGSDALGLNDATNIWGYNVAGTINSLTATGSGQKLSLDSDGNNADGLSISYTGTTTIDTTFTLTLGIGELMDRRLGFITNTSDGYVTYKQTSLGNSIDSFEDQIENMEASLNRKMETMINRFVAMEMAMADIQNQGQWLMAQVSGSLSGWGSL